MIPRAVQMAAYVATQIDVVEYGNIIGPMGKGWTNRSVNYYTQPVTPAYWDPGTPFMANPCVYTFDSSGDPLYRWFPVRPYVHYNFTAVPVNAIVPSQLSAYPLPPPIGTLETYAT